jgi:hypothetical protein
MCVHLTQSRQGVSDEIIPFVVDRFAARLSSGRFPVAGRHQRSSGESLSRDAAAGTGLLRSG